ARAAGGGGGARCGRRRWPRQDATAATVEQRGRARCSRHRAPHAGAGTCRGWGNSIGKVRTHAGRRERGGSQGNFGWCNCAARGAHAEGRRRANPWGSRAHATDLRISTAGGHENRSRYGNQAACHCALPSYPRLRRYAVGVEPVALRKAAVNELVSLKPSVSAISVTEHVSRANSVLAWSMRRAL